MNIKKILVLFAFLVLGTLIVMRIDHLVGIDFHSAGTAAEMVHRISYFVFGGTLVIVYRLLEK